MNASETGRYLIAGLIIFGGGLAWVLALGQLFLEYRNRNNYIIAGYFFLLGIWQTLGGLVYLGADQHLPFNVFVISVPCFFLSVPLLYLYFRCIIDNQYQITRKHLIHFLLPVVSVFLLIPSAFQKINLYRVMNFFEYSDYRFNEIAVSFIMYFAMFLYLGYLFLLIRDIQKLLTDDKTNQTRYLRLLYYCTRFMFLLNILWFIDRFFSLGFSQGTYLFVTVVLIGIYLLSSRYPQFLLILKLEAENARYSKSQIEKLNAESVIDRIKQAMIDNKAFRNETINLKDFAAQLAITPHQLSEILNKKLDRSFNALINEYRINEAREILLQNPDRKILAIAYDVGFNSPSAFYNAFQKFVGKTPSRFREEHCK
ncbi:helix-turn-helix domain-containing protein [bacterium]|nr:helix-turn-helix domain-containing protein [bacterium]